MPKPTPPQPPRVLTIRQERFCRIIAMGEANTNTEAAKMAGYAEGGAHVEACRLLKHQWIQDRIDEIKDDHERLLKTTKSTIEEQLLGLARKAAAAGDYSAARGCIRELNEMRGYHAPARSLTGHLDEFDLDLTGRKPTAPAPEAQASDKSVTH